MSLETLLTREEISVFEAEYAQDDMASWVQSQSARRRKIKCRMVPMSADKKVLYDIPVLEEAYTAYFFFDPEITLRHLVFWDKKVFDVVGTLNVSGQDWVWEVSLRHHPGLEITA